MPKIIFQAIGYKLIQLMDQGVGTENNLGPGYVLSMNCIKGRQWKPGNDLSGSMPNNVINSGWICIRSIHMGYWIRLTREYNSVSEAGFQVWKSSQTVLLFGLKFFCLQVIHTQWYREPTFPCVILMKKKLLSRIQVSDAMKKPWQTFHLPFSLIMFTV